MSVKYFCDACDKQVPKKESLFHKRIDAHERKGSGSIGIAWEGDLCGNCIADVSYEEDMAAYNEIKRIQAKHKQSDN